LRIEGEIAGPDSAPALRAAPLVGLAVGLLGALVFAALSGLALSPLVAALGALAVMAAATGALHEDGLADLADGLGGRDVEARLAIMRDSRLGSYGALALVFSIGLRAAALDQIAQPGLAAFALVAAASASRGLMPLLALWLEPARRDGLGAGLGEPSQEAVATAAVIALLAALLFLGPLAGLLAIILGAGAVAGVAALARTRLGGYTGDVFGAAQQAAETAILLTAAAWF
jgi:adenosylcobinamide-GDP ribazoletransferase